MANTTSLQSVCNSLRGYPEINSLLFSGNAPTAATVIGIANYVNQRIFSYGLNWKWNRGYVNLNPNGTGGILTSALQQDYVTQVTDLAWLEQGWRIDINNSTNNGNMAPKPIFACETIRDSAQTSYQANPFNLSFIPNSIAFMGIWQANTVYGCGYGVAQVPITPIQQFIDANGNILYLDSRPLNLSISSPGFAQTPIVLPTPNPYGTSGSVQPVLPANSSPGTQVTDGTVTWTVADPNGYAIRVTPLAAYSGLAWLIIPVYQKKPALLTSLSSILQTPDEYVYIFNDGFLAGCRDAIDHSKYGDSYKEWAADLMGYLRSGDRERDETTFYPSEGLTGGSVRTGFPIGPSNPYNYGGYY
jgi:hypothetical protein